MIEQLAAVLGAVLTSHVVLAGVRSWNRRAERKQQFQQKFEGDWNRLLWQKVERLEGEIDECQKRNLELASLKAEVAVLRAENHELREEVASLTRLLQRSPRRTRSSPSSVAD